MCITITLGNMSDEINVKISFLPHPCCCWLPPKQILQSFSIWMLRTNSQSISYSINLYTIIKACITKHHTTTHVLIPSLWRSFFHENFWWYGNVQNFWIMVVLWKFYFYLIKCLFWEALIFLAIVCKLWK